MLRRMTRRVVKGASPFACARANHQQYVFYRLQVPIIQRNWCTMHVTAFTMHGHLTKWSSARFWS
jgi:hypothetical protein